MRTTTTFMNVSQFRGIRLRKWGLRGKQRCDWSKGKRNLGDSGRLMERKATVSMKSPRRVQEGFESQSACYWVSWWARLTISLLAGGKLAGLHWQQANYAVQILVNFPETQKGPEFLQYFILLNFIREKWD